MTVYVIVSYDIVDAHGYEGYVPGVVPLLQKHGAEILAADFDPRPLEGRKQGVCVVLRFPSEAAARAWHDDPDYAPVRKIRLDSCANNQMMLASAFKPDGA